MTSFSTDQERSILNMHHRADVTRKTNYREVCGGLDAVAKAACLKIRRSRAPPPPRTDHVCAHMGLTGTGEPAEDGEMNEMTLLSRHRIRNSIPGGLRLSTLPLAHELPTILNLHE